MLSQQQQLQAVQAFAQEKLGHDTTGHGMDHLKRVARLAQKIAQAEGVDAFLPVVAAYLHDTIDEKLFADVQVAEAAVEKFLGQQEFSVDQQTEIMQIITQMSFANTLDGSRPQLSLAGQIVQDADWLDALGAIGIARAVYYGGKHHEKLYDPQLSPREHLDRAEYRNLANETIINHFSEKLFKLAGLLNTKTAQAIAVERETFMHQFVRRFLAEWEGEA